MPVPNENFPELLSIHATNAFGKHNSSPRSTMYSAHVSQALVIRGATEKRIQTGIEEQIGRFTFAVRMPASGTIIKRIDRYPAGLDIESIPHNPETLVIYQDDATKEFGCFSLTRFCTHHQYFGYEYKATEAYSRLVPGAFFEKGTVFLDSPNKSAHGGYKNGIELNIALMSHPATSEDGILISADVLPRLAFDIEETRVVEFGNNAFPLNLYGDFIRYQPFPEIGQAIREDGVLIMLRTYDDSLCPVEHSIYDVKEPDYMFDKATYVRGATGIVTDIKIYHDEAELSPTPFGVMTHVNKYARALRRYYKEILETERQLQRDHERKFGDHRIRLKKNFHRLIVEAYAILSEPIPKDPTKPSTDQIKQKLNKMYRKEQLDDYRIIFTIRYTITPTIGFKQTDSHGGRATK